MIGSKQTMVLLLHLAKKGSDNHQFLMGLQDRIMMAFCEVFGRDSVISNLEMFINLSVLICERLPREIIREAILDQIMRE